MSRTQILQNIAFKTVEPGESVPYGTAYFKAWPKGSSVLEAKKTGNNNRDRRDGSTDDFQVADDLQYDVWIIDEEATKELRANPKADIEIDGHFFRLTKHGEMSQYMFSKTFGMKRLNVTWQDQMDHNNHHNLFLIGAPEVTDAVDELMPTLKELAVQIANLNKAGA